MPNGDHIVSASRDKTIKMWEVATGYAASIDLLKTIVVFFFLSLIFCLIDHIHSDNMITPLLFSVH